MTMTPEEFDRKMSQLVIEPVSPCRVCICRDCIKRPCARCEGCSGPLVVCADASLKHTPEAVRRALEKI